MFESTLEDPSREAIRRLVGLFKLSAAGLVLGGVLVAVGTAGTRWISQVSISASRCSALRAHGRQPRGLKITRKRWARNSGFVIAALSLFSFGIGTIFGIIELYSLWRAQRGGQFSGDGDAA